MKYLENQIDEKHLICTKYQQMSRLSSIYINKSALEITHFSPEKCIYNNNNNSSNILS